MRCSQQVSDIHSEVVKATYYPEMAIVLGAYTLGLLGLSLFISILTYATYQLLSSYLYKWREMKPIPEIEGTYPLIGNALQFKSNAGGERVMRGEKRRREGYFEEGLLLLV